MLKHDNLYSSAQDKLYLGIKKIADVVGGTMGTAGSNVVIEAIETPGYLTTNDGFSIANSIILVDPIEDLGRKILLEAINRANKQSGDGSSTTCVLTEAILKEGRKYSECSSVPQNRSWLFSFFPSTIGMPRPMDIKRSIEECLPVIIESIRSSTIDIDVDEVSKVATISAEDYTIGERIGEIYKEIGKKGIVHWDVSKTGQDHHIIGSGITIEGAGYFSPYMCDATDSGQSTNQIRIKNPKILLTKQKISSAADLNNISASLFAQEVRDLVVLCDDIDPLTISDIIKTRAVRGFRIVVVKMPVLWKDCWFEDIAKATGASVVDVHAGLALKQVSVEHLGTVGDILVTKDDTHLDGLVDMSEYIQKLVDEDTEDSLLRASRLNTKTARYFVGAASESSLSYRRLKVEDAISAAYQALNGGIVAGGGVALLNASKSLPNTVGGKILREALKAPIGRIMANAGIDGDVSTLQGNQGYNSATGEVVHMIEEGIIDPANIVTNAIKNAISVAAVVLTAPALVMLPREE